MQDKRGFTFLELMICLAIVSVLSCFSLFHFSIVDYSSDIFVYDALKAQSEAMSLDENRMIFQQGIEIQFNPQGNINQAHTFVFDRNQIVAELGWGRLVEK